MPKTAQEKLNEGLKREGNKDKKDKWELKDKWAIKNNKQTSLTPTQEQMLMSKNKYESKIKLAEETYKIHEKAIELENLKHSNIIEEIKELKKAKIIQLSR